MQKLNAHRCGGHLRQSQHWSTEEVAHQTLTQMTKQIFFFANLTYKTTPDQVAVQAEFAAERKPEV